MLGAVIRWDHMVAQWHNKRLKVHVPLSAISKSSCSSLVCGGFLPLSKNIHVKVD